MLTVYQIFVQQQKPEIAKKSLQIRSIGYLHKNVNYLWYLVSYITPKLIRNKKTKNFLDTNIDHVPISKTNFVLTLFSMRLHARKLRICDIEWFNAVPLRMLSKCEGVEWYKRGINLGIILNQPKRMVNGNALKNKI